MKNLIKQISRKFGFDIIKYYPSPLERSRAINLKNKGADMLKLLTFHEIDLVLDVGANVGQFATQLFTIGYQGKIVSFEPLSSAYNQLLEASKNNQDWQVAERCAIGNKNGEIEINISENSESSSILSILPNHTDAAPKSAYIGSETTKIRKLSELVYNYVDQSKATLLKIDTQGYENDVLEGAKEIIPKLKGIHLELSLVPLYDGQILFDEMLDKLKNMGFSLYNLYPGFRDYRTGRLLQVMGTFFR
ncbi:FkbM family methyltransferase [Coleofasciculus sp. F4-SAH-05]|uniref:FkbM family methyltransferase n=1 Tax=Coleofasciculus sp. F4-SAH-05 TaxID=3069525 RepID=UPI0032FF4DB2